MSATETMSGKGLSASSMQPVLACGRAAGLVAHMSGTQKLRRNCAAQETRLQTVLQPPPNPSIERTCKRLLRSLSPAAHVERYGEPMSHAVHSAAGLWHA
jgi:hypothetical protein